MNLPIIINDSGDVSFFQTVENAELYLEAIDVKNNEYVAYDANGNLLNLDLETRGKPPIDYVVIRNHKKSTVNASTLRDLLISSLSQLNVSITEEISLESIIKKYIDIVGYTK